MVRWLRCLSLLSILLIGVAAVQASRDPLSDGFEIRMSHGTLSPYGKLSAPETVTLFLELFRAARPRVGSRLVDPAFMLTLSGHRGLTAWSAPWPDFRPDDLTTLVALNEMLVPHGISFEPSEGFQKGTGELQCVNLAGVERMTHATRIAGTIPYDLSSGWAGYVRWQKAQSVAYRAHGPFHDKERAGHVMAGVLLGYPDRAILGYIGSPRETRNEQCIQSDPAYATYYECGVPSYDFLPQDVDDPGITANIREWGDLLRAIYETPEMRALEADTQFREARRTYLKACGDDNGWWSDERARLGMWSPQKAAAMHDAWQQRPNDRHEHVLLACAPDVVHALKTGQSVDDVLALCRATADRLHIDCDITPAVLRRWIEIGLYQDHGVHHDLLEAARQGHSELEPHVR